MRFKEIWNMNLFFRTGNIFLPLPLHLPFVLPSTDHVFQCLSLIAESEEQQREKELHLLMSQSKNKIGTYANVGLCV